MVVQALAAKRATNRPAKVVGGALAAGVLGPATRLTGYPVLSETLPTAVLLPVLAAGGPGAGLRGPLGRGLHVRARLSGCAVGSPDSLAVTAAFFAGLALLRRAGITRYGGPLRLLHGPARRPQVYGAVIFGVVIFGVGFALTGACPGGTVAMVATGGLGGLLVLAGLVSGMWLRGATARPAGGHQPEVMADRLHIQPPTRPASR